MVYCNCSVMEEYCSPNKKFDSKNKTCFETKDLVEIAKAYNKWSKKVCLKNTCIVFNKIDTNLTKYKLLNEIKQRLKYLCEKEYCWLKLDFMKTLKNKDSLKYFTFKPKPTKNITTWFNTNNINEILQQYQYFINGKKHSNYYKYIGAVPADISEVSNFNWNELKNKYTCISIVFNTDTHLNPGLHWTSCFINNKKNTVEYFDSLGKIPNKYIKKFLSHFKEYSFVFNNIQFQSNEGTLCGLYACWFTIQKLKGKTFKEIQNLNVSDNFMKKYITQVFRPK